MMGLRTKWLMFKEAVLPARGLSVADTEELPARLPLRALTLAREGGEEWCIAMRCPCGCGQRVELPLLEEVSPHWRLSVDKKGRPTLSPSIWLRDGCCSHFFVRGGKIVWV
ncbi:DUF6527 family protein [Ralstonia pseudosolanacearum]